MQLRNIWPSGVASPKIVGGQKFEGSKCLILGKQHYFFRKTPLKAQNGYIF